MAATKPFVVVLFSRPIPPPDQELLVERAILAGVADVRAFQLGEPPVFADEIFEAAAWLIWQSPPITADVIARLRGCRALIRNGVGFDSIDLAAAAVRGIPVCNVPDYGTEEVADHSMALVLALCRQVFPLDAQAKRLGWLIPTPEKMRRLRTLQLGIVGLGRIGTAAALRARAFGFRVVFYDPYLPSGVEKSIGIGRVASLDELLRASDVISIHCPLTGETRGFIGERELALMKPTAFLVNTARGSIVQKAPLFAALRAGRLAGAGLDVVENEPLRTPEEAATPNLICTCHAAFCSQEAKLEMRTSSAKIARAAVLGEAVWNRVN